MHLYNLLVGMFVCHWNILSVEEKNVKITKIAENGLILCSSGGGGSEPGGLEKS